MHPKLRKTLRAGLKSLSPPYDLKLGFAIPLPHILGLVLVTALWGINFPVVKLGISYIPTFSYLAIRFLIVGLILLPFTWKRLPHGHWLAVLRLSAVIGTIHIGASFFALRYLDASVASIAAQLQVPISIILASFFFKEKLSSRKTLGMILAFTGVIVTIGVPKLEGEIIGVALVLLACFSWAGQNVIVKQLQSLDGWTINTWVALFCVPQFFILSLVFETNHAAVFQSFQWQGWTALLYTAFGSSLAGYGLWYILLKKHSMNVTIPFTLLIPFWGVLGSHVILGEPLTTTLVLGGGITVSGIAMIVLERTFSKNKPATSTVSGDLTPLTKPKDQSAR